MKRLYTLRPGSSTTKGEPLGAASSGREEMETVAVAGSQATVQPRASAMARRGTMVVPPADM